jgi:hypothetical protein
MRRFVRVGLTAGLVGASLAALPAGRIPFAARAARASILMALELPEMVRQAEHIAVVEVTSVGAAWDERHERIYSTVELKVVESWKAGNPMAGVPADRLTVVQPGGTVGDISMTVTGLSTFVPGERTLVFLRGPANRAQVVGMTQGKRPVRFEAASKRWMVAPPDLRSATLVKPPATGVVAPLTPALPPVRPATTKSTTTTPATLPTPAVTTDRTATRDLPLDEFRAEVKRLLGARVP